MTTRYAIDLGASKFAVACGAGDQPAAVGRFALPRLDRAADELAYFTGMVARFAAAVAPGAGAAAGRGVLASAPELNGGTVVSWGSRPGWVGLAVPAALTAALGVPFDTVDDAAAAATAELAASGEPDFLYLIIGSGLGGALVQDGVVARLPGELRGVGHLRLPGSADPCPCGRRGCAQLSISARRLLRDDTGSRAAPAVLPLTRPAPDAASVGSVSAALADLVALLAGRLPLPRVALAGAGAAPLVAATRPLLAARPATRAVELVEAAPLPAPPPLCGAWHLATSGQDLAPRDLVTTEGLGR